MSNKKYKTLHYNEEEFKSLSGLWKIERVILDTLDFEELAEKVTNVVFTELNYLKLGYAIIVLTLIDKPLNTVKRISISKTKAAQKALEKSPVQFEEISIPLSASNNLLVKAMNDKKIYFTHDLSDVLFPVASREIWNKIQEDCGIKTSMVVPIVSKSNSIGAMIFSLSKGIDKISRYEKEVLVGFTDAVGVAMENSSLYFKLKEANQRLKELSILKDEFVSIASHELRTPMTAIKSYLWLVLNKGTKLNEKTRKYLQIAYASTERTITLVRDMLTVSRIEGRRLDVNMVVFDIREIVSQTYDDLKFKADEKKIKFDLEKFGSSLIVKADKDKIREVLQNLIANALKFTHTDGKVNISFRKAEGAIEISVTDTGPGIAKSDLPKLFQKFGRLGNSFSKMAETQGTGLGLYIAKQIVSLHGGKIWVESKEGQGSTFTFSLPEAKEEK